MSILSKSFLGSLYQLISIYDQSEKTREKFISPIKKLFKKLTKSGKPLANNNIDTKVIKKINTILELENIEFKDGFLEEKIKKLVEVLQSGNIAFIDSAVHRATMPQPSLDNSEVRTAQEGFFDNKSNEYYQFLIKEFFDLMHKVVEKFIDEESKVIKRRPINLERKVSIDSDRIVVKNSTIRQRRMNALARLFDSDEIKSPCIAVALVKGHFIIGVNTPFTKDKNKLEENINSIEKHLFEKAGILQSFFKKVTELENINDKSLESLSKDTFTKLESLGFSTRFLYDILDRF